MPMWQKMKGLNYNTKPLATFYFLVFKVKIVLANSYSANNIKSAMKVINYDYLTEIHLNGE